MTKLEECRNLMRRICELPANEDELKKLGFDEESIRTVTDLFRLFDPEVHASIKRMQELIDYKHK